MSHVAGRLIHALWDRSLVLPGVMTWVIRKRRLELLLVTFSLVSLPHTLYAVPTLRPEFLRLLTRDRIRALREYEPYGIDTPSFLASGIGNLFHAMLLESDASTLIGQLASACRDGRPIGCMSASVYDTAWVSMVSKVIDGCRRWLFPDSFQYILDKQLPDGGWQCYASDLDGIINTMAALLAILHNQKNSSFDTNLRIPRNGEDRIHRATQYLSERLKVWDIASSDHVGFELLVPTLLTLLSEYGVDLNFPGMDDLMDLNAKKLAKFDPAMLYNEVPTSAIHSLEAFAGKVDFQKLIHHKRSRSMMGSPAAAAAYLVFSGTSDVDMKVYLQEVSHHWQAVDTGGFPSAFPSTIFELTWVWHGLCTL